MVLQVKLGEQRGPRKKTICVVSKISTFRIYKRKWNTHAYTTQFPIFFLNECFNVEFVYKNGVVMYQQYL